MDPLQALDGRVVWDADHDRSQFEKTRLTRFFYAHGKYVARNPGMFMFIAGLCVGALSFGMTMLQISSDPEKIWVPPGSTTSQQQVYFNNAFDPFFRIEQIIFTRKDRTIPGRGEIQNSSYTPDEVNILQGDFLLSILALQEAIQTTPDSTNTTLDDLCFKPIAGRGCLIESPTNYWQSNYTYMFNLTAYDIQQAVACRPQPNYLACMNEIGVPVLQTVVLGGIDKTLFVEGFDANESVCGETGLSAEAAMVTFLLNDTPDVSDRAARWEKEVFLKLAAAFDDPYLQVTYMAQRTVQDELSVVEEQNEFVVIVSYCVMFAYITVALGKFPHAVRSRSLLGLIGILIVVLSVATALGVVSYAGMSITMIVTEVVPFLILAIGVDNMFIIVKAADRRKIMLAELVWEQRVRPATDIDPNEPNQGLGFGNGRGGGFLGGSPLSSDPRIATRAGPGGHVLASVDGGQSPRFQDSSSPSAGAFFPRAGAGGLGGGRAGSEDSDPEAPSRATRSAGCLGCNPRNSPSSAIPDVVAIHTDALASQAESVDELMGHTLAEVGPTITAAAAGEVMAFAMGAATQIPALQQFCTVAAIAVAVDYFLQMTWFVAALAWDMRRQRSNGCDGVVALLAPFFALGVAFGSAVCFPRWVFTRHGRAIATDKVALSPEEEESVNETAKAVPPFEVCQCSSSSSSSSSSSMAGGGVGGDDLSFGRGLLGGPRPKGVLVFVEDAVADAVDGMEDKPGSSHGSGGVGGGGKAARLDCSLPTLWSYMLRGEFVRWNMDTWYTPLLMHPLVRTLVLMAGVGILAGSVVGAGRLRMGLEQQLAMPDGSYINDYFNQQAIFGEAGPPAYIVLQNVNYSDPATGPAIDVLVNGLASLEYIEAPIYSWYAQVKHWASRSNRDFINTTQLNQRLQDCPMPLVIGEDATLVEGIQQFVFGIPIGSDCCQKGGFCGAQFAQDITLLWEVDPKNASNARAVDILSTRLRTQHAPVRNQNDFIQAMQTAQAAVQRLNTGLPQIDFARMPPVAMANPNVPNDGRTPDGKHTKWLPPAPGGPAFAYSLFYVYYEQYDYIRGIAVQNFLLALGAVFFATMLVTGPSVALWVSGMVACTTIDIIGFLWVLNPANEDQLAATGEEAYGVDINAVSVVNLIMAVGLAVEFSVHVASTFATAKGTREQRARTAMSAMGSSVVTGITLTKFVGVLVLAWAPSRLFRLYYFRMYLGIILMGAFHGLCVLPALLSFIGPASLHEEDYIHDAEGNRLREKKAADYEHDSHKAAGLVPTGPTFGALQ